MTLRCTLCGSEAVFAVSPGREDELAAGIIVRRGEPDRAWCAACWPALVTPAAVQRGARESPRPDAAPCVYASGVAGPPAGFRDPRPRRRRGWRHDGVVIAGDCRGVPAQPMRPRVVSGQPDQPSMNAATGPTSLGDDTRTSERAREGSDSYAQIARGFMGHGTADVLVRSRHMARRVPCASTWGASPRLRGHAHRAPHDVRHRRCRGSYTDASRLHDGGVGPLSLYWVMEVGSRGVVCSMI